VCRRQIDALDAPPQFIYSSYVNKSERKAGMARPNEDLGLLEQAVLLASLRLHPNAYGVSIGDEIERRTGKSWSPGSIYAAIERLETKGYLDRRKGEPTAARGGRAKEYFTITAPGRHALTEAQRVISEMAEGMFAPGAV
jgi:PadR family transcriptional regulator PadR